ncbi:MAG: ABC transporter ATP-binding protein [Candidatus Bathyarchaeia archaeon]
MELLNVNNLKTYFFTLSGAVKAVDGVNFVIEKGEAMGLAGESGCGKTTVALSLLRILPPGGKIVGGKILFKNLNIVDLDESDLRNKVRWKGISLIFQGAMNALNPVHRVKDQIIEAIKLHEPHVTKDEAKERVLKLFEMVGLDPSRVNSYPHELSGGMKQRAMIAMALACNPELLIADEPSTALDVIVQAQVLQLIKHLKEKLQLSMILISHDLSIVAETCDKVAIMYAGKIVEYGDVKTLFEEPLHPYAQSLIKAFPHIKEAKTRLISIPGAPPDLINPPTGCRFHPRCSYSMEICKKKEPPMINVKGNAHYVSCHLIG